MNRIVSKEFDFEFDRGMIAGLVMLVLFPPLGIIMLASHFRKLGRSRNRSRQMRNMGLTAVVASIFYAWIGSFGWASLTMIAGLGLAIFGQADKRREARFRKYLAVIGGKSPISLSEIAARSNERLETVERDLEDMIHMGYFGLDTYIDHSRHCLKH